jgi:hypothetical protein
MPGHVFIAPGDVRRLACDAWLVPASRKARPEHFLPEHWKQLKPDFDWPVPDDGDGWWRFQRRVFRVENQPEDEPQAWVVNVSYAAESGEDRDTFYRTSVRQALDTVLATLGPGTRPRHGRAVPLLALPFLGGGWGMRMVERGPLLRDLLTLIHEALERIEHTVDVALVTLGTAQFAAAQHARLELGYGWPGLDAGLQKQACRLADLAGGGHLALFLGAGVGVGAGLPTWEQMLEALAREHDLPDEVVSYLTDTRRDILDRTTYLEALVGGPAVLREGLTKLLGRYHHYALSHALLAGLPVREVITTNYDQLFEWAWDAAASEPRADGGQALARKTAVIPYHWAAGHQRWLLKLHACVSCPESIVLTRASYIRYSEEWAALEGLLQAMLLTRHMLFVGFSLKDPNFIRILDAVRRIGHQEHGKPQQRAFGTALMLRGDPMFERLYEGDLQWLAMEAEAGDNGRQAARRLELFLDCLLARTRSPAYLLDEEFDSVLDEDERRLRDLLLPVARAAPADSHSPAWEQVEELLRSFGWRGPDQTKKK